jgi:tetratricopeptide (TPR) repeat protein
MADSKGHSPAEPIFEAQLADPEQRPARRTSWAGVVMIFLVISILVGPLIYMWVPQETARWGLAAAKEQRLDGDLRGAVARLDRTLERFPLPELYLERAEWHRELGNYEQALADVNEALRRGPRSDAAYLLRSQILQHLGRFEEAVEDMQQLLTFNPQGAERARALNGVAYARALANRDLDQALAEVEEALDLVRDNAAMRDTRGFIHYLRGDLDQAAIDLDAAVMMIEEERRQWSRRLNGELLGVVDKREEELLFQQHAQSVAVIRYHRALLRDSLGQTQQGEEDRQRVLELGFEPGDHLF